MFRFLGRLAVNHSGAVCLAWVVVGVGLTLVAPSWRNQTQDDDIHFMPAGSPSLRGHQLLEQAFPQDVSASKALLVVERPGQKLTAADFTLVDKLIARLQALKTHEPALQINGIVGYHDLAIGKRLMSADGHCTLIQVALGTPYMATRTRFTVDRCQEVAKEVFAQESADAPQLFVTGPAGVGRDLVKAGSESLDHTTIATVALVIIVLLAVYRAPLLALIPLITIGVSAWVALNLLALASLLPGVHLMNVSQVFAIVILFGAGTDYCLFLIARYREELERGRDTTQSVRRSVSAVGEAIAASAGTVVCGLAMMGFASFAKIRCAGPVIALALAVGVAASLTLTPALLDLTGASAFWPGKVAVRVRGQRRRQGVWDRMSKLVVRRPGWVWIGTFLLLAPFALLGLSTKSTYSPVGDLNPHSDSVKGFEVVCKRFTAGESGPVTVLLAGTKPWDCDDGKAIIQHLSRGFGKLDNVAEVRSLTQPLGKPMEVPSALGSLFKAARVADPGDAVRARYLARREQGPKHFVTRLDVVLKSDPFQPASVQTLRVIEHWLQDMLPGKAMAHGEVQAETQGVTVHTRDLMSVIQRDRAKVNLLVLTGILAILWVLVKKAWLASYLLATVLFSYYATLGMTTIFATVWGGRPLGEVEWRVPFFLFTILVAVGEDYNILMVTRVMQERQKYGAKKGIRRGLARTGGTITACGVIMAGTFATLMLAGLGTLVQVGFALAVGVLLDTFLIRPLLVPAFMLMVWKDEEQTAPVTLAIAPEQRAA